MQDLEFRNFFERKFNFLHDLKQNSFHDLFSYNNLQSFKTQDSLIHWRFKISNI
jgi:hypothetical protein